MITSRSAGVDVFQQVLTQRVSMLSLSLMSVALPLAPCAFAAPPEKATERSGAQLYYSLCASCHGPTAHGDGPVAETLIKPPADLTKIAQRNGGAFPAEAVHSKIDGRAELAAHGPRAMPIWGRALYFSANPDDLAARKRTDEEIDRIVDYLRSIQVR